MWLPDHARRVLLPTRLSFPRQVSPSSSSEPPRGLTLLYPRECPCVFLAAGRFEATLAPVFRPGGGAVLETPLGDAEQPLALARV